MRRSFSGWLFGAALLTGGGLNLGGCPEPGPRVSETRTDGVRIVHEGDTRSVEPGAPVVEAMSPMDDDLLAAILATLDRDGDGLTDEEERATGRDPDDPSDGPDIDGDGIPNGEDRDTDGDGVPNSSDFDIDGDGISNRLDPDIDADGLTNGVDDDIDADGIANRWDLDMDADGEANLDDDDADADGDPKEKDKDKDKGAPPKKKATGQDAAAMARALAPKINATSGGLVAKMARLDATVPGSSQGARMDAVFRQAAEAHARDVAGVPGKQGPSATVPDAPDAGKELDDRLEALETLADELEDEFLLPPPDDYLDDLSTSISFLAEDSDDLRDAAENTVDYRKFLAKKLAEEAQRFVNEDRLRSNPNSEAADVVARLAQAAERTGVALSSLRMAAQTVADVRDGVDADEIADASAVVEAAEREEVSLERTLEALRDTADLDDGVDSDEIDTAVQMARDTEESLDP